MPQTLPFIFLSHSGADTEAARELKRRVENAPDARAAGLKVWFDKDDLRPGTPWSDQIARAIENEATAFVVYVGSGGVMNWIKAEVDLAISRATTSKPSPLLFIPVLAAESRGSSALPPFAKRYQSVRDPLGDGEELVKLVKAVLNAEWDQAVRLIDEPFVGLRSMREEEADRFFGRDAEVEELVEKFRKLRLVAIVADSGTGKSSLAHAGFVPAFRGGALMDPSRDSPDDRVWHVVTMRPGANPEEGLRTGVSEAAEKLGQSPDARSSLRRRVAVADPSETAFALQCDLPARKTATLLIVDQFEELLTQTPNALCAPFVRLLLALADGDKDIRILMTVRADYFNLLSDIKNAAGQPVAGADGKTLFERLTGEGRAAILPLKRISDAGLGEAVRKPLRLAGHKDEAVQDALLNAVRRDISDQPSDLPLLQVALRAAWREHRSAGVGLMEAYESVGGALGALAKEAETARKRLSETDQARLESIFVRLVRLGDTGGATRRAASLDEFDSPRQALLRRLGSDEYGRLVVVGETSAEIAHEALITQWPWLQGRLKDDVRNVRRLDRLMMRSSEWSESPEDRKGDYLASGAERELFAELAQQCPEWLSPVDRDFVATSVKAHEAELDAKQSEAERRQREREEEQARKIADAQTIAAAERRARQRTRIGLFAALALAGVALGGFFYALREKAIADHETYETLRSESVALTALGGTEATRHPVNAAKLALAAWPRDPSDTAPKLELTLDLLGRVVPQLRERIRIPLGGTIAGFSPDGKRIVTAPGDKTARIWDATDGHEIATLQGHDEGVIAFAAIRPDGNSLVTAAKDGAVRVWDLASAKEIGLPMKHGGILITAALSPDGKELATASADNSVKIWNVAKGATIATLEGHDDVVTSIAFSADSERVVTASADKTAIIWNVATGAAIATLQGHGDVVTSAAFSGDGERVVTASDDRSARIWNVATGAAIAILQGHGGPVVGASFSPDGTRVVTASADKTARIWSAADGHDIGPPLTLTHDDAVNAAVFSADGGRIVTASDDGTARIWDAATGREVATLKGHDGKVFSAAFNPDATRVVTASYDDNTTRVWDVALGRSMAILAGHSDIVSSAAFSPDGGRVVTASADKTARVWDASSGSEAAPLEGHDGPVTSAAFSPDGTRIVTASEDKMARVWDAASGRELATLKGHDGPVTSAAFSPDGTRIITASDDKTARVWDAATRRELMTLTGHSRRVTSAVFSTDGKRIVTASWDKTARVWNAASGIPIATLEGHGEELTSAAFSPDGRQVVTASWDKTARIWDASDGREIAMLKGHEQPVTAAVFSADGARILTASADLTARIWDVASRREIAALKGHGGALTSAALSRDGKRVVTASQDKTARVWDVSAIPTGDILVVACAWLPDKKLDNLVGGVALVIDKPICAAAPPPPDPPAVGLGR